jgi:type IV pilus assembly protein PilB
VEATAVSLVPDQVARRYRALPIGFEDSTLIVAMSDPSNVLALDDIRTITGMEVKPVVSTASDVEAAIDRYGRFDQSVEDVASFVATGERPEVRVLDGTGVSAGRTTPDR